MTATTIRVQMAQRKDTAANWTAANPILLSGEIGYETDTKKFKIGDGSTNWNSLAYLPIPDGSGNLTITGNLEIGSTGSLTFEGSTADGFETTLAVTNPTADRTITLPDRSGTVITSGDTGTITSTMILDGTIVNGDVNASAAIAGTKITPDFGAQTITTTGVVSAAVGAAATPSITFTGDTNTGIYSPGADQVAISTGGSGRLVIDSSGNTTFGSTTADGAGKVAIRHNFGSPSTVDFLSLRSTAGVDNAVMRIAGYAYTGAARSAIDLYQNAGTNFQSQIVFSTDPGGGIQERLRITSAGLVGVGTSSPQTGILDLTRNGTAGIISSFRQLRIGLDANGNYSGFIGYGSSVAGQSAGLIIESLDNGAGSKTVINPSGGNVGIGTTSPVALLDVAGSVQIGAATGVAAIEVGTGATGNRPAYIDFVGDTTYADYGLRVIREDGGANTNSVVYHRGTGALAFNAVDAGAFQFVHNTAERARIDSSGRLLVGTSSARLLFTDYTPAIQLEGTTNSTSSASLINNSNGAAGPTLFFAKSRSTSNGGVTVVSADDELGVIAFNGADGTDLTNIGATIKANVDGTPGNNDLPTRLVFSTTNDGASSPTERMRITNDGAIWLGANVIAQATGTVDGGTFYSSGVFGLSANNDRPLFLKRRTSDGSILTFNRDNAQVGDIFVSTTATSYVTTSDYRLKENVTPVTDGINRLQQLKPSRFNFIAEPGKTVDGFLAHEAAEVVPECVTGEKDAIDADGNPVYQGIDQAKLVPLLTAALQEAIGEIESLKARVAALESA